MPYQLRSSNPAKSPKAAERSTRVFSTGGSRTDWCYTWRLLSSGVVNRVLSSGATGPGGFVRLTGFETRAAFASETVGC